MTFLCQRDCSRRRSVRTGHGPADGIGRLSGMTTDQKGAIAEACIAATALKLGIEVYRPVAEGGRYDMILDIGGKVWRVQCKWASRRGETLIVSCESARRCADGFIRRRYTAEEVDAICAYSLESRSVLSDSDCPRGEQTRNLASGRPLSQQPAAAYQLGG